MPPKPSLTLLDRSLAATAAMLFTLFARPRARRDYPATAADAEDFSVPQRRAAGRYMRVNHVGEVCAQALYQSQAVTAQNARLRQQMHAAASEETDHLAWCERRLEELGGRKSVLNPLWYGAAFALGAVAGLAGDRWNLGLVVETERQVVVHLDNHLGRLPQKDCRSRQIVTQMRQDEQHHAEQASAAGAAELPPPFKHLMRLAAKVMTSIAHWI